MPGPLAGLCPATSAAGPACGGAAPAPPGQADAGRAPARRTGRLALPAVLLLADTVALAAAAAAGGTGTWPSAGYAAAVLALVAAAGQYRIKITPRASDQAGRLAAAAAVPLLVLLPWAAPGAAARLVLAAAGLLVCGRAAAYAALRAARRRGLLTERVLLVGAGPAGREIADLLLRHTELGLRPAGFLDDPAPPPGPPLPLPLLGSPAGLREAVRRYQARRVIVAFPCYGDDSLVALLRAARPLPAEVCVVPRLQEIGAAVPRALLDEVWGIPLVPLRRPGPSVLAGRTVKRAFDLAAALALLVLAGPLMIVLGLAMRLQSHQPALFRQVRVTGPGRTSEIVKLRTLASYGDPDTSWSVPSHLCTGLGRFLRASHLDELPQLLNVVRGQMSLVGPRPERPYFARRFEREIPGYAGRHRVTAGLTGWAQVHGLHGDTSIRERARFDNAYVENWSFWLDLAILARTAGAAARGILACAAGSTAGQPARPADQRPAVPPAGPPAAGPRPAVSPAARPCAISSPGGRE